MNNLIANYSSYPLILFTIVITVAGYWLSRYIFLKYKNPLLNPVVLTTVIVIFILLVLGIDFEQYKPGKDIMTYLLGPATVALALPLYNNRLALWRNIVPVLSGVLVGCLVNISVVVLIAKFTGLEPFIIKSLAAKSITAPIAIEVTKIIHGDPALVAIFVVVTGMLGATFGLPLLSWLKITNPMARGLSIGTTSHGQGTAIALNEGETQGAMAGIAMALSAVVTAILVPILIKILL